MVREAQQYDSLCESCVRQNSEVLTQYLKAYKVDEYVVVGEYSPEWNMSVERPTKTCIWPGIAASIFFWHHGPASDVSRYTFTN